MVAPVILSVVAFIAGRPVPVQCDPNLGGFTSPGAVALTPYSGNVIYALPRVCDDTTKAIGSDRFAGSLGTFIHEAAHARGYRRESCAEMVADLGVYQVLRDFYKIPFFTPTSVLVGRQVRDDTRSLAPEYQIESCWSSGPPG